MKLLAAMLLLSLPTWGQQELHIVPVARGALLQADGGIVDVNGGTWFSTAEVIAMGKDHADLRKQNEYLEAHVADVPYKWVAGALSAGMVIGLLSGFVTARAVPR